MPKKRVKRRKKFNYINIFFLISSIIAVILLFTFIKQKNSINDLLNKQKELHMKYDETSKKIKSLTEELKKSNSLEYIEKRAREDLGMIKKDEKIYIDKNSQLGTGSDSGTNTKSNTNTQSGTVETNGETESPQSGTGTQSGTVETSSETQIETEGTH